MPKHVDRDERLEMIYAAALRLIISQGVSAASLRNVAQEANLNIGSVRHYVGTHAELLSGAVEHLTDQVEARIDAQVTRLPGASRTEQAEIALDMLEELVPLDDQRRNEAALWLALNEHARTHPALATLVRSMSDGIREFVAEWLRASGIAATTPAYALGCLLDGLTVAVLADPETFDRRRVRAILRWQLIRTFDAVPVPRRGSAT